MKFQVGVVIFLLTFNFLSFRPEGKNGSPEECVFQTGKQYFSCRSANFPHSNYHGGGRKDGLDACTAVTKFNEVSSELRMGEGTRTSSYAISTFWGKSNPSYRMEHDGQVEVLSFKYAQLVFHSVSPLPFYFSKNQNAGNNI